VIWRNAALSLQSFKEFKRMFVHRMVCAAQGYELRNAKRENFNFLREQIKEITRKEVDFVEEDIEMVKSIKAPIILELEM